MPKGTNPKSHRNRQAVGGIAKEVNLLPAHWELANRVGGGNHSKGLRSLMDTALSGNTEDNRSLFYRLPIAGRAKLAIELLLSQHPQAEEIAEAALYDLEDLEIENLLDEAIIDGYITPPRKGAWIV